VKEAPRQILHDLDLETIDAGTLVLGGGAGEGSLSAGVLKSVRRVICSRRSGGREKTW